MHASYISRIFGGQCSSCGCKMNDGRMLYCSKCKIEMIFHCANPPIYSRLVSCEFSDSDENVEYNSRQDCVAEGVCPECKERIHSNQQFCTFCGTTLKDETPLLEFKILDGESVLAIGASAQNHETPTPSGSMKFSINRTPGTTPGDIVSSFEPDMISRSITLETSLSDHEIRLQDIENPLRSSPFDKLEQNVEQVD